MASPSPENKSFADAALRSFLAACDSSREQARGHGVALGGMDKDEGLHRARHAWTALQRARIFAVDPLGFAKTYRQADVYTTEVLAGLKWYGPAKELLQNRTSLKEELNKLYQTHQEELDRLRAEHVDETDPEHLMVACSEAGRFIRFPDQLPFDSVFLSYGSIGISTDQVGARTGTEGLNALLGMGFGKFVLNGHLLWIEGDKGYAYSFVSGVRRDDPTRHHCLLMRAYADGEWDHPYDLDPWTVPSLISAINEHRSVTQCDWTPGQRMDRNLRPDGKTLPLPKPYYIVRLEDEAVGSSFQRHVRSTHAPREFSHRFDVRAHECVRVLRGVMPMDPEVISKLTDRGYRIYTDVEPLSEDHVRLIARRIPPKRGDEWMAILTYWKEAHIRGPEGKPYVPAIRTGV